MQSGITYLCVIVPSNSFTLSAAELDRGRARVPGAYARALAAGRVRTSLVDPSLTERVPLTFGESVDMDIARTGYTYAGLAATRLGVPQKRNPCIAGPRPSIASLAPSFTTARSVQ
jgi:hypothetical protein